MVAGPELFDLDQTGQQGLPGFRLSIKQQLVNEALAAPATMHQQILQLLQSVQMHALLGVAQRVYWRTSRRLKRYSERSIFCPSQTRPTMSSISSSNRRVLTNSSKSSRIARSISYGRWQNLIFPRSGLFE
jgi:hypothetical protein